MAFVLISRRAPRAVATVTFHAVLVELIFIAMKNWVSHPRGLFQTMTSDLVPGRRPLVDVIQNFLMVVKLVAEAHVHWQTLSNCSVIG